MKKYYWIALLLGLLVGVSYLVFGNKKVVNDLKQEVLVSEEKTTVTIENEGDKEVVKQIMGYVEKWDPVEAKLTVNLEGEEMSIALNPLEMKIFIPVAQKKTNQIIVLDSKENENWETAFCAQDTLTVGFDESDNVLLVSGSGYRACGRVN